MAVLRLGAFGTGLSGKAGSTVFVQTSFGVQVRDRVIPTNPQTPAQQANRRRLSQAVRAWSNLDDEAIARWEAYAQSLGERDPASGLVRVPRAMNVFTALYTKRLQLDAQAPVPQDPPFLTFFGDVIAIAAEGAAGGVLFSGSGPNSADIVTELLLQPLASRGRKPFVDKYRGGNFHVFSVGDPSVLVPVYAGWCAAAFRFIRISTGQTSVLAPLGKVLVSPAA